MTKLLQCLRDELVRRDYAAPTIRSYIQIVEAFRQQTGARLDRLTSAQLRRYHLFLLEERRLAVGTVVTQICALRFFCRYVLKRRDVREDLPYPKQRLRLPVVLSPEEVHRLIAGAKNLYHRTPLLTLYGAGLRRSEACQLKVRDTGCGWRLDLTITEQFARSMSLDDALDPRNLLCYEMNGESLPEKNGFPIRLIAPGWYGVANVKWLTRIEVRNQRHAGNYMARDYVTIREEQRDAQPFWTFSTVRHDRLKSAPARVVRRGSRYVVLGAAWGAPIAAVEVRIDNGPWLPARLFGPVTHNRNRRGLAWRFWAFGWGMPATGQHMVTSRAFDADGNVQPAPDDPFLASKVTFWESNGHITRLVLIP